MNVVVLLVAAPIPVGHRVQVVHLVEPNDHTIDRIAVVDLEAGIRYGDMRCFERVTGITSNTPRLLPMTLREDLALKAQYWGRVAGCQVAGMGFADRWIQTTLQVDDVQDQPYP